MIADSEIAPSVPPDDLLYREVMTVDLESPEAIADFCTRFGVLLHSAAHESPFQPSLDAKRRYPFELSAFHADDFRALVHEARDMTRVLWSLTGHPERLVELESPRESSDGLVKWYAWIVGLGLRDYEPRLIYPHDTNEQESVIGPPEGQPIGLWAAVCAQHFNAVRAAPSWRECQRPDCDDARLFVHQRGRSKYGGHQPRGVLYCSERCAKIQAKREYRKRQRGGEIK